MMRGCQMAANSCKQRQKNAMQQKRQTFQIEINNLITYITKKQLIEKNNSTGQEKRISVRQKIAK